MRDDNDDEGYMHGLALQETSRTLDPGIQKLVMPKVICKHEQWTAEVICISNSYLPILCLFDSFLRSISTTQIGRLYAIKLQIPLVKLSFPK